MNELDQELADLFVSKYLANPAHAFEADKYSALTGVYLADVKHYIEDAIRGLGNKISKQCNLQKEIEANDEHGARLEFLNGLKQAQGKDPDKWRMFWLIHLIFPSQPPLNKIGKPVSSDGIWADVLFNYVCAAKRTPEFTCNDWRLFYRLLLGAMCRQYTRDSFEEITDEIVARIATEEGYAVVFAPGAIYVGKKEEIEQIIAEQWGKEIIQARDEVEEIEIEVDDNDEYIARRMVLFHDLDKIHLFWLSFMLFPSQHPRNRLNKPFLIDRITKQKLMDHLKGKGLKPDVTCNDWRLFYRLVGDALPRQEGIKEFWQLTQLTEMVVEELAREGYTLIFAKRAIHVGEKEAAAPATPHRERRMEQENEAFSSLD